MAAMTMPFEVRDSSWLRGLQVGDEVGFELVVTKDDSWIAAIHRLSETSPALADAAALQTEQDVQRVQVGEVVPDFALTDQNDHVVRLRDFRGQGRLSDLHLHALSASKLLPADVQELCFFAGAAGKAVSRQVSAAEREY